MLRDRPLEAGDEVTFATAAELMLGELEEIGRKPTTLANYRSILGFRLLPRFGESSVNRVRRSQVEAFAAQMIREGASPHTRANVLKLLSQVFNYSVRQRWCRENPCLGVGARKFGRTKTSVSSADANSRQASMPSTSLRSRSAPSTERLS
jgi:site-specific recombinase XerC